MFDTEDAIIRIDMSEYMEKQSNASPTHNKRETMVHRFNLTHVQQKLTNIQQLQQSIPYGINIF